MMKSQITTLVSNYTRQLEHTRKLLEDHPHDNITVSLKMEIHLLEGFISDLNCLNED